MLIDGARWQGGELILSTRDPEAMRFAMGFVAGQYNIVKQKKRRSLDANAYAWVLIDKIAEAVRMRREDVYRNAILGIGGASETVCVKKDALESLRNRWERNGLGWQVETMPSKIEDCVVAILHYGSSAYDTHQMSVLIDNLVQDAQALGIETMPPEKLASLVGEWDG